MFLCIYLCMCDFIYVFVCYIYFQFCGFRIELIASLLRRDVTCARNKTLCDLTDLPTKLVFLSTMAGDYSAHKGGLFDHNDQMYSTGTYIHSFIHLVDLNSFKLIGQFIWKSFVKYMFNECCAVLISLFLCLNYSNCTFLITWTSLHFKISWFTCNGCLYHTPTPIFVQNIFHFAKYLMLDPKLKVWSDWMPSFTTVFSWSLTK
jgi:hypothetical protein